MAEYKSSKTGPGAVIFFSVVAIIVMVLAVGKFPLFQHLKDVTLYFESVSGIKERTSVTYAGRKCGEVKTLTDLEIPKQDASGKYYHVKVVVRIDDKTPINTQTKAMVTMVGMLGDKELDFVPGDPTLAKPWPAGKDVEIYGETGGLDVLINTSRKLVVKLEPLLNTMQLVLANVNDVLKDPDFKQDIKISVAHAKVTLASADAALKEAREMLSENRINLKATLNNARELTEKGKTTVVTLNEELVDMRPKLETLIANLEKLTADLKPRLDELLTKAGGTLDKAGVAFDKAGVTLETTHQLLADNRENIGMMLTSFRETGYNAKHFTHTFRIIFSPWSVFCDQKKPEPGASTKAPEAQPAAGGTPAEAAKPAAANATK